jgi:hypothetical protein
LKSLSDIAERTGGSSDVLRTIAVEAEIEYERVGQTFLFTEEAAKRLEERFNARHKQFQRPRRRRVQQAARSDAA